MSYAEGTRVSVERSRAEVEKLLKRAGAERLAFLWAESGDAQLACQIDGLPIVFRVRSPVSTDLPERHTRTQQQEDRALEQEERRRWRALVLIIKAKLELVESGQSTLAREFMADVMLPNGDTLADAMLPKIRAALKGGKMPRLALPGGKD